MAIYVSENEAFKEKINFLKNERGVSFNAIAEKIGVSSSKMKNIRSGQSSANIDLLHKLIEAYPELKIQENDEFATNEVENLKSDLKNFEQRISNLEQQLIKALNRIENLEEEAGEHGLDNSDLKQLAAEKKRRNEELKKEKGIE